MESRFATLDDLPTFRKLWSAYLVEQHELGSPVLPSEKNLEVFERVFRHYVSPSPEFPGVVVMVDDAAVFMAGAVGEVFETALGRVASGHGTYVVPDARRLGLSAAVRESAFVRLRELGFSVVTGVTVVGNDAGAASVEKLGFRKHATQWMFDLKEQ